MHKSIYLRPDTPSVEPGQELAWLYEKFGEQYDVILYMNYLTFEALGKKVNININDRIADYDNIMMYGYRVMLEDMCPAWYIRITDAHGLLI